MYLIFDACTPIYFPFFIQDKITAWKIFIILHVRGKLYTLNPLRHLAPPFIRKPLKYKSAIRYNFLNLLVNVYLRTKRSQSGIFWQKTMSRDMLTGLV